MRPVKLASAVLSSAVVMLGGVPSFASGHPAANVTFSDSRLAVIAAFDIELEALLESAEISETLEFAGQTHHIGKISGQPVVIARSGRSLVAASATAQAVIDHHKVAGIIVCGIAGGVNPNLQVADVVVAQRWGQYQEHVAARPTSTGLERGRRDRGSSFESFDFMVPRPQRLTYVADGEEIDEIKFWFDVDASFYATASRALQTTQLHRCLSDGKCLDHQPGPVVGGNGVSGNGFIDNADYRAWIWRTFQASAVDQETAAIAQIAYTNRIPYIAFRALSDLAGGDVEGNQALELGPLAAANAALAVKEFLAEWRRKDGSFK